MTDLNPFHGPIRKLVKDSLAISFGPSSADKLATCSRLCRLWSRCYASRSERYYVNSQAWLRKLARLGPVRLLRLVLAKMPAGPFRWARFSVNGAFPDPRDLTREERREFRSLIRQVVLAGIKRGATWHIPTEDTRKAEWLRRCLRGTGVVVRRSCQVSSLRRVLLSRDPRSWVVGTVHNGPVSKAEKAHNTALAHQAATIAREAGQTAIVCPYPSLQCGECLACGSADDNGNAHVDLVLYPFHG